MRENLHLAWQAWRGRRAKEKLGPHVGALLVTTAAGTFAVDPEDRGVGWTLRRDGEYGREERERIARRLDAGSRLLVVGAHVGALVVPLSKLCLASVAIEANPATFRLLEISLALSGVTNCRALNLAAGERDGTIPFLASRANSGGSKRVPKERRFMYTYDAPSTIEVPSRRLDDLLPGESFDVIVMDIEGSEPFALSGMPRLLASARALVVEFVPHHLRHVSGVTVEEFVSRISPHFSRLTVPSKGLDVGAGGFRAALQGMFDRDEIDDGVIFEKEGGGRTR